MTTREALESKLEKFKAYKERYKNYPGSPNDDSLLNLYGYTVREERSYINRTISTCKKALQYMSENNLDEIPEELLLKFYL